MFVHAMRKPLLGQTKRQGGISLIPDLWDEIDRIAKQAGVPRNQVMERALMQAFGVSADIQKMDGKSRSANGEREPLPPLEGA